MRGPIVESLALRWYYCSLVNMIRVYAALEWGGWRVHDVKKNQQLMSSARRKFFCGSAVPRLFSASLGLPCPNLYNNNN